MGISESAVVVLTECRPRRSLLSIVFCKNIRYDKTFKIVI